MATKYLSDEAVRSYFLQLPSSGFISHLQSLENGLIKYSSNPSIVPLRTKVATPNGKTIHFFMPVVDDEYCGVKTLGYNVSYGLGFVGSINVIDPETGLLKGVVDAKELTGIRTALTSNIGLYANQSHMKELSEVNVTVFGSGLQAFWHVLACAKIFPHINFKIVVVYRSNLLDIEDLRNHCKNIMDVVQIKNSDPRLADVCDDSHIIYGTVPSSSPGILKRYFSENSPVKFTYISIIGSYQPHMHECDTDLISLFQQQGKKIIVDSKSDSLIESGELIDANVNESQLIEVGQLSSETQNLGVKIGSRTLILAKIVGLAIMDVATSKKLLEEI